MNASKFQLNRQRIAGLGLGIAAVFALVMGANANKPGSFPDIPVTTTFVSGGNVVDGTNTYAIESDGIGSYFNNADSVSSILQGGINDASHDWILDTRNSTRRTVLVDLRNPLPNGVGHAPFAWQDVPVRIIEMCHLTMASSFPGIARNQSITCPMFVVFDYAGASYRLAMYPPSYPETNYSMTTCTATNSANQCIGWTIAPITQPDSTVRNIAQLQKAGKNGSFSTVLGDFYVSFNIEVTNP